MSVNTRQVNAPPEDVFKVLADAVAYGRWVVGPRKVVSADASWPAVGSTFVHQHGRGPLAIRDETKVVAISARSLELKFSIRQLGMHGRVGFVLEPVRGGTQVIMEEEVTGGYLGAIWNPVFDRLLWARNLQGLQRLKDLVEQRSTRADTSPQAPPSGRHPLAVAGGAATGLLFWSLSNLRRARIFHPVGAVHTAELVVSGDDASGSAFLTEKGRYPALVRESRGIGLPDPFPDILGLAIKVPDRYGTGADQDLLLASAGGGVVGRRLLRLRRNSRRSWFSSIVCYEAGTAPVLIGARSESKADRLFGVYVAGPTEPWRQFATLRLATPTDIRVTFDPWHSGPDFVPTGLLNELRGPAYKGSRSGRTEATDFSVE